MDPVRGGDAQVRDENTPGDSSPDFVDRRAELQELRAGFEEAQAGRGRLFLLVGEAGIGKTRLAGELARHAGDRNARVLWGRCWEGEGAPAYWPWTQVIRAYVQSCDESALRSQMGSGAAYVAHLVPEVAERFPERLPPPPPSSLESDHARFLLFDGIGTLLRNASSSVPLVLVLDDLHWADLPSLLLLQFLVRVLHDARFLAVGTYRDVETARTAPQRSRLADLARDGQRIPLRGLSQGDVGVMITHRAGRSPARHLLAEVHQVTEGNPFFVDEIVRLLAAEGRLETDVRRDGIFRIPDSVRQVIRRRIAPLGEQSREALSVGAVAGRVFEIALLQDLLDAPFERVVEMLDDALAAGLVETVPGSLVQYRFSHALVRETLYDDLPPSRRPVLHRRVGEALERRRKDEPMVAELAHHFRHAALAGAATKAIEYCVRAAREAASQLAFEQAASQYASALEILELGPTEDRLGRAELLLALGHAHRRSGNAAAAREAFTRAVAIARSLESPEILARSALGVASVAGALNDSFEVSGRPDETVLAHLEEALDRLGPRDGATRATVLARLASALYWSPGSGDRRRELSREAVDMARRVGDRDALLAALVGARHALWGAGNIEERRSTAEEILVLATKLGDRERTLRAHEWLLSDALELGDVRRVDAELEAHVRLAEEFREPFYLGCARMLQATIAFLEGRFTDGETLAAEAVAIGQATNPAMADLFQAQLFYASWMQGKLPMLEGAVEAILEQQGAIASVRCGLIFLLSETGRDERAKAELDRLAANDFADLRDDVAWLPGMALLAQACTTLGDAGHAATLYERLRHHAGQGIVITPPPTAYLGPVAHYLGLLAATLGRRREAEVWFDEALQTSTTMRARPFAALTEFAWGTVLLEAGERELGNERLERARKTAEQLGIHALAAKIRAGEAEVAASPARPAAAGDGTPHDGAVSSPAENVFRREAEYWTVSFGGETLRLRDTKGLRYVALLLRHPGREMHVADLDALARGADDEAPGAAEPLAEPIRGLGDAGELLDARARREYQQRLRDLRAELAEAKEWRDLGRTASIEAEIDSLAGELSAAYGLGGRARKAADTGERVRKAVTNRIRDCIGRLQVSHRALALHLEKAIRMGTFCCYEPERAVDWKL